MSNYPKNRKSRIITDEFRKKMSKVRRGKNYGLVGKNHPMFGKTHTLEAREKIKQSKIGKFCGENSPHWIKDRTKIKQYWTERNNPEYKQWRIGVFERDKYMCKINNKDCNGRIEAHHILGWTEHSELRYEVNNGITLCHFHHPRKREEESKLSPYFKDLIFSNL